MRIALITWSLNRRGGIEEVSYLLNEYLGNQPNIQYRLLLIPRNRVRSFFYSIRLLYFFSRGYSVMVLHLYIFEQFYFLKWLRFNKCKKIVWAHGIEAWGNFGKQKGKNLHHADQLLAVSQFTAHQAQLNWPSVPVKVIPLAIDHRRWTLMNPNRENFSIITVGRLSAEERYKGHDLVLKALRILQNQGYEIHYHVVGTGDDIPRLQNLCAELNIDPFVHFHGFLPDRNISQLYALSSAFVMPSQVVRHEVDRWGGEGFGLVYLEAGWHGLPVIACQEGGQTDCIVDQITGFLVNPDPREIADRIRYLYHHPEKVNEMGSAARYHVEKHFLLDRFQSDIAHLISTHLLPDR